MWRISNRQGISRKQNFNKITTILKGKNYFSSRGIALDIDKCKRIRREIEERINDDKEYEANDSKTIYNLSKKGKLVLNNYYEKELLVTMLNEKKNKKYDSLKEIEKDYKLVSKKVYRRKTKIREVTN